MGADLERRASTEGVGEARSDDGMMMDEGSGTDKLRRQAADTILEASSIDFVVANNLREAAEKVVSAL